MSKEARSQQGDDFDPQELLKSADFFKREGDDVSDDLRAFEGQILQSLSDGAGRFEASIASTLMPEVGAEIFDTLLSDYLKWYKSRIIAVRMPIEGDHLAFAGYVQIERPWHVGLGIAYEMVDAGRESVGPAKQLPKIGLVPGSVRLVIDASWSVRAAIAAMKIESSINHMLADPAGIVRKTLECRLRHAYDCHQALGDIGISIENGIVCVAIYPAAPA